MTQPTHPTAIDDRANLDPAMVDAFLEIAPDGSVTVYCGKVELGTGIATAMAQIVAGELDLPLDCVRAVMGDTGRTPDQGTTAGSKSVQVGGVTIRQAAATARRALLERAAERLDIAPDDLEMENGRILPVDRSGPGIALGDLAGEPLAIPIDPDIAPHPAAGSESAARVDLLAKVTGDRAFVHDHVVPGMLHGRIVRPWVRTMAGAGRIADVDVETVSAMPGVVAVVREEDFLGVVAEREEEAVRAADALRDAVTWKKDAPLPSLAAHRNAMQGEVAEVHTLDDSGGVDAAFANATTTMWAKYVFPYVAHASLGPSCAVADVREDRATVWSATQGPYALRSSLAALLGMPAETVRVIHREGAGCYGHNGADDVAADAALLSRAVGRPVRVQWSRRDEFAWEPKSPAMSVEMVAGLDADGEIVAWSHDTWTPTHVTRPGGQPDKLLAGQEIGFAPSVVRFGGGDRNAPLTYAIPEKRTTVHWVGSAPLRPSALRSLGGTHNTAANEWFLDEVANQTGVDPLALRLKLLDDPRAVAVVEAAAERAGWGTPVPEVDGQLTGRGIAFVQYELDHAYVATVAEVAVDPASGKVRVTRVVVAHDCGRIVNPDGVRAQVEGNVIQGVSRALKEAVTWDKRKVTSLTWAEYPILTFPEAPEIEVVLIDRPEESSMGAGEPAICTVPAAIGNAIFDATGARLRKLPFEPARVRAVLRTWPPACQPGRRLHTIDALDGRAS